jgi:hypothetical protein
MGVAATRKTGQIHSITSGETYIERCRRRPPNGASTSIAPGPEEAISGDAKIPGKGVKVSDVVMKEIDPFVEKNPD